MPKISVIVPVYNAENYLHRCVNSILKQTYCDIELILVDDGSIDGSPAICDEYLGKDTRVKVIHQTNAGVSMARNAGIEKAEGEYIAFVDSDDWIAFDYIEEAMQAISRTNAGIYFSGYYWVEDNKCPKSVVVPYEILAEGQRLKNDQLVQLLCCDCLAPCWGKVYARELIGDTRFDPDLNFGEDMKFVLSLISKECTIFADRKAHYFYFRISETSLSRTVNKKRCKSAVEAYQYLYDFADDRKLEKSFYSVLQKRWTNDLLYMEYGVLNSKIGLIKKYALLRVLLSDKRLNQVISEQDNRYLKRYATNPALLMVHYIYNLLKKPACISRERRYK